MLTNLSRVALKILKSSLLKKLISKLFKFMKEQNRKFLIFAVSVNNIRFEICLSL